MLALIVLLDGRCVVVGANFVVERVEERERFDLGGIDALADNEPRFGGATQRDFECAACVVRAVLCAGEFDFFGDELFAVAGCTGALDNFAFQDCEVPVRRFRALGRVAVAGNLPDCQSGVFVDVNWNGCQLNSLCAECVCACIEIVAGLRGTSVAQCETRHNSDDLAVNGAIQPYQQAAYETLTLVVCNCCTPIKSIVGLLVSKVASDWGEAKAPPGGGSPIGSNGVGLLGSIPPSHKYNIFFLVAFHSNVYLDKNIFLENFQNFYNILWLVSNNFSLVYIIICIIIWWIHKYFVYLHCSTR